jgi:hypothetical protein
MAAPSYDNAGEPTKTTPVECRRCGVICERIVYPVHCLRSKCRYVYAYEDSGSTYFGCIQRVFAVEIDLAPFEVDHRRDVYGGLKARIRPLPECHFRVERAYPFHYTWQGCANPTFLQHPDDYAPEAVRILVDGPRRRSR